MNRCEDFLVKSILDCFYSCSVFDLNKQGNPIKGQPAIRCRNEADVCHTEWTYKIVFNFQNDMPSLSLVFEKIVKLASPFSLRIFSTLFFKFNVRSVCLKISTYVEWPGHFFRQCQTAMYAHIITWEKLIENQSFKIHARSTSNWIITYVEILICPTSAMCLERLIYVHLVCINVWIWISVREREREEKRLTTRKKKTTHTADSSCCTKQDRNKHLIHNIWEIRWATLPNINHHTHTEKEIERRTDTPNTVHSYSNSIANTYIVEQEIETVKAWNDF